MLAINNTVVAVAAGGAGAGGGGNRGTVTGDSANNTAVTVAIVTQGMNGLDKTGDGGGGGGGGGGVIGGVGGGVRDGDQGGLAGSRGTSARNTALTVSGTEFNAAATQPPTIEKYSVTPNSTGGLRTQAGTNGYAVLEIETVSLPYVKVNDVWKPVTEAYVKVAGSWQTISEFYIKEENVWKELDQGLPITVTALDAGVSVNAGGSRAHA